MFIHSDIQVDEVKNGEVEDDLVVVCMKTYPEDGTILTVETFDDAIRFPKQIAINAGNNHVVLLPDSSLTGAYSNSKVDFSHDVADIAGALLDGAYLPPEVFGRGARNDVRKYVFDALGMQDEGVDREDYYREKLREIAGRDEPADDGTSVVYEEDVQHYLDEYSYNELKTMASDAGIENANVKKDDLATYLASQEE